MNLARKKIVESLGSTRALVVFATVLVTLAGCATDPSTEPPSRPKDDKAASGSHESVDVSPEVRADFDTAISYLRAGETEKGTKLLLSVAERAPRDSAPYVNLAIAYQQLGDLTAAEESVKKALAIDPAHPVANTEYGRIYRKTGRFDLARKSYESALKSYPDFLPARKNLGILCDLYLRDFECALNQYQKYSAAVPDDRTVRLWIADLQRRLGKTNN